MISFSFSFILFVYEFGWLFVLFNIMMCVQNSPQGDYYTKYSCKPHATLLYDAVNIVDVTIFYCIISALHKVDAVDVTRTSRTPAFWAPRCPMITHTIDQFILDPKPILLTSSYWIPSQNKSKSKLQI